MLIVGPKRSIYFGHEFRISLIANDENLSLVSSRCVSRVSVVYVHLVSVVSGCDNRTGNSRHQFRADTLRMYKGEQILPVRANVLLSNESSLQVGISTSRNMIVPISHVDGRLHWCPTFHKSPLYSGP